MFEHAEHAPDAPTHIILNLKLKRDERNWRGYGNRLLPPISGYSLYTFDSFGYPTNPIIAAGQAPCLIIAPLLTRKCERVAVIGPGAEVPCDDHVVDTVNTQSASLPSWY